MVDSASDGPHDTSALLPGAARRRRPLLRFTVAGAAIAVAAGLATWMLVGGDGGASALPEPGSGPALVTQAQLERLAVTVDHPVYWAGPKAGFSYELTETSTGRTFIRYLPQGVKAGDPRPDFLVVGTYALTGSFSDLKRAAMREGAVALRIADGGIMLLSRQQPLSVYFAYPGAGYQIEVFDPSGNTARQLVLDGRIRPVT